MLSLESDRVRYSLVYYSVWTVTWLPVGGKITMMEPTDFAPSMSEHWSELLDANKYKNIVYQCTVRSVPSIGEGLNI